MPTDKNDRPRNPVEITATNNKLSNAELQQNYDKLRDTFSKKYGVDFNGSKNFQKINADAKRTEEKVGEGKEYSKEELQKDFNGLKESFVAKGGSYKFSELETYSKKLEGKKLLEPEKPKVQEKTETQKFLDKARATGGELGKKLKERGQTEATIETQGTSYDNLYTKEQFKEYQASNQVLKDNYGLDLANNTKMTEAQVKKQIIPKLKDTLEPKGSSPEQIKKNKEQFREDLNRFKEAFTDRFSEPDQFSTISRIENSDYLQETRAKSQDIAKATEVSNKKPEAAKQIEKAKSDSKAVSGGTFENRVNQQTSIKSR